MVKLAGGLGMLAFGLLLVGWLGYNLLVERQKEFQPNIMGFVFLAGLVGVGQKWVREGWEQVGTQFQRRKPAKKKKRSTRRTSDDDV